MTSAQYVLEVPRGFSVHVFKTPSPPLPPQSGAVKPDFAASRTASTLPWKPTPYPPRPEPDRKLSSARSDTSRLDQVTEYERALDLTRSKSSKPYGIVPSAIPDTYIYERSISSVSDLPGSPLSSSSSDTDSVDSVTPLSLDVSSIRASSSLETLEASAYYSHNRDALTAPANSPYGSARGPVIPLSSRQISYSSRFVPADHDDDDDTVISDDHGASRPSAGQITSVGANSIPTPPAPVRRNSDERSSRGPALAPAPPPLSRREPSQRSRSTSPTAYAADNEANLRLPPGLQYASAQPTGPPPPLHRANTSPTVLPSTQRSSPEAIKPPLIRALSNPEGEAAVATAKRCVRWTEDQTLSRLTLKLPHLRIHIRRSKSPAAHSSE